MKFKLESPLSILPTRSGNINSTLDFIPGSAVRGALAACFLEQNNLSDPAAKLLFGELFLSDKVIYHNFYRANSLPVPFTARACKLFGRFKEELPANKNATEAVKDSHGVQDYLCQFLLYEELGIQYRIEDECRICKFPMEQYGGYFGYSSRRDSYYAVPIPKREITRTAIHAATQATLPGILYTFEVIDEQAEFEGSLETFDPLLQPEIRKYIKRDAIFFLGMGKTRGLGKIKVTNANLNNSSTILSIDGEIGRFHQFNNTIKNLFVSLSRNHLSSYFSITLLSDAIIQDEYGRYLSQIPAKVLFLDTQQEQFKLKLSFCSTHKVSGWSNIWKLPKQDDIAISKGSVFLYESQRELTDAGRIQLIKILQEVENKGIGKRRNEGFGKVSICDPFHWRQIE